MRARIGLLLLVVGGSCGLVGLPRIDAPHQNQSELGTPNRPHLSEAVLQQIRDTGQWSHPASRWSLRARRVSGDVLYFVEFFRRAEAGPGFDLVGKAVSLHLVPAPERPNHERILLAHATKLIVRVGEWEAYADERMWELPASALWFAEPTPRPLADLDRLTPEQREFFRQDFSLDEWQEKFLAALGEERFCVHGKEIQRSFSGRVVYGLAVREEARPNIRELAIAEFDAQGVLARRWVVHDVQGEVMTLLHLLAQDNLADLRLTNSAGNVVATPWSRPR